MNEFVDGWKAGNRSCVWAILYHVLFRGKVGKTIKFLHFPHVLPVTQRWPPPFTTGIGGGFGEYVYFSLNYDFEARILEEYLTSDRAIPKAKSVNNCS